MKHQLFTFLVSAALLLPSCASILEQGIQYQQEGNAQAAIDYYQKLLDDKTLTIEQKAHIHNNLAIAYLQSKDPTKAKAYFALAQQGAPQDKSILANAKLFEPPVSLAKQPVASPSPVLPGTIPQQVTLQQNNNPQIKPSTDPEVLRQMAALRQELQQLKQAQETQQPVEDLSRLTTAENIKWGLVIGISDYDKNETSYERLPNASKDAQNVYDYLTREGGFAKENVKLLLDKEATTVNIKDALNRFLRLNATRENDVVFIYYSGHGDLYNKQDAYLIPYGVKRSEIASRALLLDEVNLSVSRLPSQKVAMFVDSCHSGSLVQGVNSKGVLQNMTGIAHSFLNMATAGRLVMTSSKADEESLEVNGKGGLFTHYLLKGLRGEADNSRDRRVTVDELYDYVYRNVYRDAMSLKNQSQTPQKNGNLQGILVDLSR